MWTLFTSFLWEVLQAFLKKLNNYEKSEDYEENVQIEYAGLISDVTPDISPVLLKTTEQSIFDRWGAWSRWY